MGEWQEVSLSDVAAEVTVGYVGTMADQYRDQGVPFLRSLNVHPHRIDLTDIKFIDQDFHATLKKSALAPGDVVTVRTGKPGTSAVIPGSMPVANCSDLVVTRPGPNLDARWLSYYLNFVIDSHIGGQLVGAVQQHFNVQSAKNLKLLLPGVGEQRAIADVLGAIDDKIAANEWVIEAAQGLMLSVVQSVNRWEPLTSLTRHSTASVKPEDFADLVAHFSLPAFDDGAKPEIVPGQTIKSNKFLLSEPCVLFSKLNPRIPRIWNVSFLPSERALASTEFVVLAPVGVDPSVLWATLSQREISEELRQMVAGTSGSHQRIRPQDLLSVRVRDVRALDSKSADAVSQLGKICYERRQESRALARTRDELLPLLMSGKARVKDAETAVSVVL
jgi:type I restriction enzyme, S subunit